MPFAIDSSLDGIVPILVVENTPKAAKCSYTGLTSVVVAALAGSDQRRPRAAWEGSTCASPRDAQKYDTQRPESRKGAVKRTVKSVYRDRKKGVKCGSVRSQYRHDV